MNLKIALIQVVAATLDPSKDLVAGVGKGTFAVLFFARALLGRTRLLGGLSCQRRWALPPSSALPSIVAGEW